MLVVAFFTAVFSSVSWLIYAVMFLNAKLGEYKLWEQSSQDLLLSLAVVFVPVFVIWVIFGYVNQFFNNRAINRKQSELLKQLQKNQDYTDLVVRVMLDAEHEIKDGFVLNKFDVFINDMNEALGEIIQRCNIASSMQLDQLWQRVRRGEKWALGKAVLEASKNQSTFDAWVKEKVNRDKVFRGSLLEFCSRYQNLLQLLEKHDRDRVFLQMIETGVFGKVYSVIAPLSEGVRKELSAQLEEKVASISGNEKNNDYASVLKIATMEEPEAEETIFNVDIGDEEEIAKIKENEAPVKRSFLSCFKFFGKAKEDKVEETPENDPFFQALHNSFRDTDVYFEDKTPTFSEPKEKEFTADSGLIAPKFTSEDVFGNSQEILDNLRETSDEAYVEAPQTNSVPENKNVEKNTDDEDVAYPFGGWTDEKNYNH